MGSRSAHLAVRGYDVEARVGRGCGTQVWRARDRHGDLVALKLLRRDAVTLGPIVDRSDTHRAAEGSGGRGGGVDAHAQAAVAEAAVLSALDHPHLVRLRDVVPHAEGIVLVLDYAARGSLAALLAARGRISVGEVIAVLAPVGAALAYLHREGVVHGDVTPANVLFTSRGSPVLADLGVARLDGDTRAARSTAAYVDPSVAAGCVPGPQSDVFMLGAVALHALTGAAPWPQPRAAEAFAAARSGVLPEVAAVLERAGVPLATAEVVVRALTVEPHARGSAADFALELRHSGRPVAVEFTAGRMRPGSGGEWETARPSPSGGTDGAVGGGVSGESAPATTDGSGAVGGVAGASPTVPGLDPEAVPAWTRSVRRGPRPVAVGTPGRPAFARGEAGSRGAAVAGRGTSDRADLHDERSGDLPPTEAVPIEAVPVEPGLSNRQSTGRPRRRVPGERRPGERRPGNRPGERRPGNRPGVRAAAIVAAVLLVSGAAWWHHTRSAPAPVGRAAADVTPRGDLVEPTAEDGSAGVLSPRPPVAGDSTARARSASSSVAMSPQYWTGVLERLDARRAAAFARRDPALLSAVYSDAALRDGDAATIRRIVPAGCGLHGVRTDYAGLRVATLSPASVAVTVSATLQPSRLMCAGTVRGRSAGVTAARVRIVLMRTGAGPRIESERTG